jgi:hypothetical protein
MSCIYGRASLLVRGLFSLALLWAFATPVWSWGVQGHQVVATIAWQELSPLARAQAVRLLALEPGQTLPSVSTWADEQRGPATAPWHYLNFPRGTCQFDAQRDCPDGQCVLGAIERQRAILASTTTTESTPFLPRAQPAFGRSAVGSSLLSRERERELVSIVTRGRSEQLRRGREEEETV